MSKELELKVTIAADASKAVAGVTNAKAAIDQVGEAAKHASVEAGAAGSAINTAFGVVGVRSTATIQAEILRVNQALDGLAREAKVTGADFDRAWSAGQAQIARLRAELSGAQPAVNQLGGGVKSLSSEFGALAGQVGGAFAVLQAGKMFIDANSQAETFARTMTILTGSSEKAAAEMEYVRKAAGRLGLDVQDAAKAYTQLVAATKGTALEGEGARKVFEAVSGAMASLGKSSAETNNALLAVNQMASKGTVQMEELKGQLGEALPGAMKAAANGAGLTVAELSKMIENGNVLAEDLLPALASGLTEMYGVGKANNDTFVAQWARLKNAVTETLQVIGDSGVFKAMAQGVGAAAQAVGVFTVGLEASAKKIGVMAGAIANGDFGLSGFSDRAKQALGEIDQQTAQSLTKIAASTKVAAEGMNQAGAAAEKAGQAAEKSSAGWLAVDNAYTQVEKASTKQIEVLKVMQDARDAEAASIKASADTYGTQAEKLSAATTAAQMHERATKALADQVRADLEIAKARLASLEEERNAEGQLTKDKEKLRETLVKTIEAKQAEAEKTKAAADASHAATNQAQAAAAVYADHSKQVYALRDAWQAAEAEYQRLAALSAQGVGVAKELKAADEERAKALLLYRDALADATAAAERHVTAERTASSLTEASLQNDKLRAETILEVARQRGNEKDIAEAQIAVWRIELQINEAQAEAAKKEAEAILLVARARRAELEASDALTPAKRAELDVMEASAKAKQLEAEKYDLLADRMRKLSYETRGLESTFGDLSSSADQAAASADRAAASYDGLASSIRSAGQAKDGFVRNTRGEIVTTGPDVGALAAKYTRTPEQGQVFEEVFNYYYQQASQRPENYSTMQGLQFGSIEQQAALAAADEAMRRASQLSAQTKQSSSGSSSQVAGVYRLELNTNGRTNTVQVSDQASVSALISALETAGFATR